MNAESTARRPRAIPWLRIWTRPRREVRAALDERPRTLWLLLPVLLHGFTFLLERAQELQWGEHIADGWILAVCLVGGPLIGLIGYYYIMPPLLAGFGRLFGGRGGTPQLRVAYARSMIPAAEIGILSVLLGWMMGGAEYFEGGETIVMPQQVLQQGNPFLVGSAVGLLMVVAPLLIVLMVWAVVVASKAVGEAHGVGGWAGLGAWALSLAVLLLAAVAAGMLIALATGSMPFAAG